MNKKEFINLIGSDDIIIMLAKYSYSIVRERNIAQDIAQETLVKAISSFHNFDGQNISAWLKIICKRTYIDWIRKKREVVKKNEDDDEFDGIENLNPENMAEYRIILENIDALDPPKPEIIKSTFLGNNQGEIAKQLNIKQQRVSDLLAEARNELRDILL